MENDIIFAYLNKQDTNHQVAKKIFYKLKTGELSVEISSVSLIEMELIYKSEKMEDKLLQDFAALVALPNVEYVPLTPYLAVASVYIRKNFKLSFFDSHYAATALNLDKMIISFDKAYERVPGLTRIDPEHI